MSATTTQDSASPLNYQEVCRLLSQLTLEIANVNARKPFTAFRKLAAHRRSLVELQPSLDVWVNGIKNSMECLPLDLPERQQPFAIRVFVFNSYQINNLENLRLQATSTLNQKYAEALSYVSLCLAIFSIVVTIGAAIVGLCR
jgi:hypothetical protein